MSARERERALLARVTDAELALNDLREEWRKARREADEEDRRAFAANPTPEGLVYAAAARCLCGAGLAYLKHAAIHGAWDCSAILLGQAIPEGQPGSVQHTDRLPFAFYSVKTERQANCSTRPTSHADAGAETGR